MYPYKVKLELIEITPYEIYNHSILSFLVINQPDDYPTIYSYGQFAVGVPFIETELYQVGKQYDLNLNEVITP